jgi:hypothetical protein
LGNRQFQGGRRFRQDQNPAGQSAPAQAPQSPNNGI